MVQQYQVLARRYRPQKFSEVVGQTPILETLKNALRSQRVAHAYLFCGSRGVGKTTIARLFAKALNCQALGAEGEPCGRCPSCLAIASSQSLDVIEIDGASHRGIEDIRQINETAGYAPSGGRYKIYIIDEVHMLTKEAFNALLKTLEEPPARVKFFFATTEPHKVLSTIVSRCQRFDLGRIAAEAMEQQLVRIIQDLGRVAEARALARIIHVSEGSLRDAELLLDQLLCFTDGIISEEVVRQLLGLAPEELFFALDRAIFEGTLVYAFELVEQLFQSGRSVPHFVEELIEHYRQIVQIKFHGEAKSISSPYVEAAKRYSLSQVLFILEILVPAGDRLSKSLFPRVSLELMLVQLIRSRQRVPLDVIVRRLAELEEGQKREPVSSPIVAPMASVVSVPPVAIAAAPSTPVVQEPYPGHYATLLRFAAVELEGRIQ